MGRFRFHQDFTDILLKSGVSSYSVDKTILAEELLVHQPDSSSEKVLSKYPSLIDAKAGGAFSASGSGPGFYARWENEWLFDPVPDSSAHDTVVRIYHFADLPKLYGDLEALTRLPERYQLTTLVYGVLGEIAPAVQVTDGKGGFVAARSAYTSGIKDLIMQEKWEPLVSHSLLLGRRWVDWDLAGHVGGVR